jgi:hypothetical protein
MFGTTRTTPTLSAPRARAEAVVRGWRPEWTVAALVFALYGLWIALHFLMGRDVRDFIVIGKQAILRGHASSVIRYDPRYVYRDPLGYDGQYCYFLALDPVHARWYMDFPAYRYTRILYPMLARLLAFGQASLVPYTLVAVNWVAVPAGTLAVGAWLRRKGLSPWLALIYGLSLGMFIALNGDLTEPLAYAFVALAVYLLDFGGERRMWAAGVAFALAILTRETTAVFAVVYGGALLAGGVRGTSLSQRARANWRRATTLLVVALAPFAVYKLFLLLWLGSLGTPASVRFEVIPFAGLAAYWPWSGFQVVELLCVVMPALLCAVVALRALRADLLSPAIWTLLANVVLFVLLLPASSYIDQFASARLTLGVVLAALYCIPICDVRYANRRTWLALCAALWLMFLPLQAVGMLHGL